MQVFEIDPAHSTRKSFEFEVPQIDGQAGDRYHPIIYAVATPVGDADWAARSDWIPLPGKVELC